MSFDPPPGAAPAGLAGQARHSRHRILVPGVRRAHRSSPALRTVRPTGLLVAACVGLACGLYDLRTGRSDTMALFLGGAAFLQALIVPAGAVPRAIVMGLSIPAVYFGAHLLDVIIPYPPMPHYAVSVAALVPALAGTLLGLGVRKLLPRGGPARRSRI